MPSSSIESYCTFTLASDVTAGGLPSEAEIAKDLESSDDNVCFVKRFLYRIIRDIGMLGLLHVTAIRSVCDLVVPCKSSRH